ncbi:T9SS type A sorting domain-containing protein [Pontibacter sp. SGAir0037]|uniref:T9SS type A sorting domain-containing protein n=1 Tax=Pontibacter sp. SGAir0037 TaxID=2571030 RepID=UPI0010CD302D|nr:T9SS type A sorting domain-containing protein [Pontibacter sp. SGAir0037]QCR21942.1 hypothetical protein C1N53_06070 [Pontibacter sp. SGAir0037]
MKQSLCKLFFVVLLVPLLVHAEGSKQLTPNTTTNGSTDFNNTSVGYLQHDDGSISNGFLKPSTWTLGNTRFTEDYRLYVRLKPGETVYYGVRRIKTNETATQSNLILTLKYGTGAGTQVNTTTLTRNTNSTNQSSLNTGQNGVIGSTAQARNGPNYGGRTNGYSAISYTNNTGVTHDFYLEFTQVGESTMSSQAKKSWYDLWDMTVVGTDNREKPGRVYSKYWSFTAGAANHVLSSTFAFFPLIPNQIDGATYYVKKITLAGMRPFGFRFVTNEYGSTPAFGTTFQERRKSQIGQSDYSQYMNFVNNPDEEMWPSADDPEFSFSAETVCDSGNPTVEFTSEAKVASNFMVQIDVNGDGYKPNTADVLIERSFTAGKHTLIWNGRDAYGSAVPSGTKLNYTYKSYTSPMNFPVYDAEGNAKGFKSENVRPVPSTVNDYLYWDDSNLNQAKFSSELNGFNASQGAHLWGATADDGDALTINTWAYGFTFTESGVLTFTYDCSADVGVTNTVSSKPAYYVGDVLKYTVVVQNFGPNTATNVVVTDLLPASLTFQSYTASNGSNVYDPATGKWMIGSLLLGESRTLVIYAIINDNATITTTAVQSHTEPDLVTGNNSASNTITAAVNPLPVSWLYFNAQSGAKGVWLEWATYSEINNVYFAIERSLDGMAFTAVGQVQAAKTTNQQVTYSFHDSKAPAGEKYYRIKQVDADGSFEYSKIVVLYSAAVGYTDPLAVAPNPAHDEAHIDLRRRPAGVYALKVYRTDGREVSEYELQGGEDNKLDVSQLQQGQYILQLIGEESAETLRMIKL